MRAGRSEPSWPPSERPVTESSDHPDGEGDPTGDERRDENADERRCDVCEADPVQAAAEQDEERGGCRRMLTIEVARGIPHTPSGEKATSRIALTKRFASATYVGIQFSWRLKKDRFKHEHRPVEDEPGRERREARRDDRRLTRA